MPDDTITVLHDDVDALALVVHELREDGGLDRDRIIEAFHLIHRALETLVRQADGKIG